MAPLPHENTSATTIEPPNGDRERIVISGMSGLYPESHNVRDLADILYNKINPIGKEGVRYDFKHPEVVENAGKIPGVELFDAQFFGTHFRLATSMDSMSRKILEHTYQAIYDAGINPSYLSGKKIGAYVGSCFSETGKSLMYDETGFGIAGCSKAMFANRISYWLNAKGPSMSLDEACCSSAAALEQAYLAMIRGECEAAVVAGAFLCLHPQSAVHFGRSMNLCSDGKTKVFSENADGCAMSEAINVLFLQKAKDAVRIYADLVHVKCEYIGLSSVETGPRFGFYREPSVTAGYLKKFYKEANVPPQAIEYVEAFGAAMPETDKDELDTIDEVFCNNRDDTLLVGSIMSNIGYTEAATGIAAVTKVLLGYHTGELAANLHYERPRKDVACLREGRVRIVSEHHPWSRGYAAVNGISITGVNSHVLLHGHYKLKDLSRYKSDIPYLVPISARQDTAVKNIIENLKSRPIDPEELALLHNIHQYNTSGHLGRGYVILGTDAEQKTVSLGEKSTYFDEQLPLWFVYSGMGSQWPTMGAHLMRIPIFAAAIQRCHVVLEPKGLNIVDIITLPDKKMFDNILHSFVGIAAIQIGLTDVLKAIGLVPDGIIGHSVGELGCAYADGCLTADEMILSAYSRGLVSLQTPFIRGSMAAVGLGYSQIIDMCPSEIEVACHNGPESCTVSGPAEAMTTFVAELTAKEIFAREVPCSNIAYHSRYIESAGPRLLEYLKEVIPNPRPRSEKWLSSSVPQDKWDKPLAKFSSAEYHTNNLLNPVLFEETSRLIPSNAIIVEVAPHGLLQAILKRSMSPNCVNIPITRRNHPDNVIMLLDAIGTLYTNGFKVTVQNLYPKVQFPVSTGTPLLSHLVEWAHEEHWPLPLFSSTHRIPSACCKFLITLFDSEHTYLMGNTIRGKTLYPFAAALVSVWDTLAMVMGVPKKQLSVQFRDVHLYSQPILHERRQLSLSIVLHRGTGNFEILEDNNAKVASGLIIPVNTKLIKILRPIQFDDESDRAIQSDDVYQVLEDRGYSYSGKFRSIVTVSSNLTQAELAPGYNWVTLIDSMIQLSTLRQPHSFLAIPTSIRSLYIDLTEHINSGSLVIHYSQKLDSTRCGGVQMDTVLFSKIPTILQHDVLIESISNSNKIKKPGQDTSIRNATLVSNNIGDYNSLHWVEAPEHTASEGLIVKVDYAGITNTDFKKASGIIPLKNESDNAYGMDFSGVLKSGARVMGILPKGACSKQIQADPKLLWLVPSYWNLEDAATVPYPYMHAFYLLVIKGRIESKMNVLIHGGAGALGQAAIAVALAHNCTVFTTVSDVHKKIFLLRLFPGLQAEFIGNSRDGTFKDTVLMATKGRGCEIVISSLKGDLKQNNIYCCAVSGIIIDVNQLQDHENVNYRMAAMTDERSYCLSDFSNIISNGNEKELKELHLMICDGIVSGFVRPLTRLTFGAQEAPRAFRLLAASAHHGRVILDLTAGIGVSALSTCRRITCNAEGTYLIISSEDSLGLYWAERLILRGAKRLHIHLKSGIADVIQPKIQLWKNQGLEIVVTVNKLDSVEKLLALLKKTTLHDPIEGIYLADIQKEGTLSSLDKLTRQHCPSLKHFIVINSSGNVGQNVCAARHQSSLQATMLSLAKPGEDIWMSRNEWCNFAVDAIEQALINPDVVMQARPLKVPENTLLQEVAQLEGITVSDSIKEKTLKDLGLGGSKLHSINNLLKHKYNIHYDEEELSELTIKRINDLDHVVRPCEFDKLEGLSQFINYVATDELLATTDMVSLPTLVTSALVSDDDFDPTKKYVFILPGLEGLHERFRGMCKRLKIRALVLQPGLDSPIENLQDLAKKYAEILIKKAGLTGHFYLMGYETGTAVALEVAGILEGHGLTGTIFCLGCTANDFQKTLKEELKIYQTDDELRDAVLNHIFKLLTGDNTTDLNKALKNTQTWTNKVEMCVRMLLGKVPHSAQYARELIETVFARIVEVQKFRITERKLRSKIVYLRAAGYSDSDLGALQRHSEQPLVVHQLSAPLPHAALDLRCAAVINDCLSCEITDEYDNGNTCELYKIESGSFKM